MKLQIILSVTLVFMMSSSFAKSTLVIPINNQPIIDYVSAGKPMNYGLTDEEITRRVERGAISSIPASRLREWQANRVKQQESKKEPVEPVTIQIEKKYQLTESSVKVGDFLPLPHLRNDVNVTENSLVENSQSESQIAEKESPTNVDNVNENQEIIEEPEK